MILIKQNYIQAKRVVQNNQEFLVGTFQIRQVRTFTKYTEHLIVGYEEIDDVNKIYVEQDQIRPIYNPEIQRKTNNSKVEKIADFLIHDPSAMFPTNIVIAIPNQVIDSLNETNGIVTIELNEIVKRELDKDEGKVFLTIIDGQHRIKGIERAIERINFEITSLTKILTTSQNENLKNQLNKAQALLERLLNFELIVTFFIDPTLEYQAMIFATINKTQTKVPENLVFSLFGLTKEDSPQKTSLEVVLALNGIEKSPFYNRIRLVGGNYARGEKVPLSQATMVKSVLNYICNNAREAEIDRFKKRTDLRNNPKNLPFRPFYSRNQDEMIVRILYSYFNAVRSTFKDENGNSFWDINTWENPSNILQTNVGYQALMKLLWDLINVIPEECLDNREKYEAYLLKAKSIDWKDLNEEKRYPYTSSTINTLYEDMHRLVF